MKRVVLLSIFLFLLTGCQSIQDSSLDTVVNEFLTNSVQTRNTNRLGYRYYLPKGLKIEKKEEYNDVITDQKYNYYLYVDLVSYYHKIEFTYHENKEAYYSKRLEYKGHIGYIEINKYKKDQYLIEIMYNYAKIEVVVYESDIHQSVAYAMSILSTITYNDSVIQNHLGSDTIYLNEEDFDIFQIVGSNNYLEFSEDEKQEDKIKDPDYIN